MIGAVAPQLYKSRSAFGTRANGIIGVAAANEDISTDMFKAISLFQDDPKLGMPKIKHMKNDGSTLMIQVDRNDYDRMKSLVRLFAKVLETEIKLSQD